MSVLLDPRELHRALYLRPVPARADAAVAHGRAHLDYQRRIATASVHGHNARVMTHERERRT